MKKKLQFLWCAMAILSMSGITATAVSAAQGDAPCAGLQARLCAEWDRYASNPYMQLLQALYGKNCEQPPVRTAQPQRPAASAQPTAQPAATVMPAKEVNADRMLQWINQDRQAAGLQPLQYSEELAAGAMAHSQDMVENAFFSHTSPNYGGFAARAKGAASAENIARYGSLEKAHAALMASESHRANLMNSRYTKIGIGVVYNPKDGGYYVTQWFG